MARKNSQGWRFYAYQVPSTANAWKASTVGQTVLANAAKVKYSAGVFEVGESGNMIILE
ncbi:MAG: hypothetical protein ACK58N_02945 [Synechocystis sp.]